MEVGKKGVPKRPKSGVWYVPSWLMVREDVELADKVVAAVIWAYQKKRGACYLSQRDIGRRCGLSREVVNLSIARLTCGDGGRRNGKRAAVVANFYRRPLVQKLDRMLETGVAMPYYRVEMGRDTAAWWMMEEEAGRTGIGDLRTKHYERQVVENQVLLKKAE